METNPQYKVANLTWDDDYLGARSESIGRVGDFFISFGRFSDQMFLIKCADFRLPIYNEIRPDSHFYPWGDTFEKRVFSAMVNRTWLRLTFTNGSYTHHSL
jgi:hypothetical protein